MFRSVDFTFFHLAVYENRIQDVLGVVHKIGNGSFTKSSVKALVSNAKFKDENLMGQTTLVSGSVRLWIFFFFDQTRIEYYFGEIIVISINSGFTINTDLYNITPHVYFRSIHG